MRAFVAVEISGLVQDGIISLKDRLSSLGRMVSPDNLHITLCFLGEITESQNDAVQGTLARIIFESFKIRIVGVGIFPRISAPRVVWLGIDSSGARSLTVLARTVQGALAPLGFVNGSFRPHVTMLRIKKRLDRAARNEAAALVREFAGREFGSCAISEIKLKQSVLTRDGPVYTDLQTVRSK